ncbi:hypothetical protein JH288_21790 (plasmid) [Xanthomonas campestris pv. campestris]|uniref:hypothetical protein n=1 Tax=Xanthomonas campestris TaxID=339 RepID=UPI002377D330|nr:hypothetical protein [Xanthomonas campestris]WDL40474.1 hypothetical protein JH288_21790 [Xanthomonas campestris pv. campestris]
MRLSDLGIYTNPDGLTLWLSVLPRIAGEHPNAADGKRTTWLRLDTITEIKAELAIDSDAIDERRYIAIVVADQKSFHPTVKLLDGNEVAQVEFTIIDMITHALMVLKR